MSFELKEKTKRLFADGRVYAAGRSACFVLLLVLLFVGIFSSTLLAQPKPSNPPPISNRFLFIIDTSSSMKRLQQDELKIVYELLASSAVGQMHSGDSVGFWTFNQDVHSELPAQTWTTENEGQTIQRTMNFLQQQHYARSSRLEKALADMQDIIQSSDIITVFIVSSGHGKMTGTPFDKEINALYKQSLAEMRHDPKPVITVLQGRQGKIVHFTVNAMPWPVVVPEIPIPIRETQTLPAQANVADNQNTPPATNTPIIPQTQPPVAKPSSAPQTVAQPTPLPGHPAPPSPASAAASANTARPPTASPPPLLRPHFRTPVVAPAPPQPATPSKAAEANSTSTTPQTQSVPPTISPSDATASSPHSPAQASSPTYPTVKPPAILPSSPLANNARPIPAPSPQPAPPSNHELLNPPVATASPKPLPNPQTEPASNAFSTAEYIHDTHPATAAPATNSLASRAYAFVSPEGNGRPKSLLIAGIALLLLAVVLVIVMVRRSRSTSGPSLISQTMGNGSKK